MTSDETRASALQMPDTSGMTTGEALRAGGAHLAARGVAEAGTDSRRLLLHATGLTALDLVRDDGRRLTTAEAASYGAGLERRARHEPVSRITGTRGFYGRDFIVTPDTLDPRADTETLIEATLGLVRESGFDTRPITIADIGTGTGCILVTLLAELPLAEGVGIDVSPAALAVARSNADRHGVARRARFVEARGLADAGRGADLIVSNPPYIPGGDIAGLDPDVRDYDPRLALDGGADGLDIYREIAAALEVRERPGWAVFEVGAGQAGDVAELLLHRLGAGHRDGKARTPLFFRDLGGVERCVAISTQS